MLTPSSPNLMIKIYRDNFTAFAKRAFEIVLPHIPYEHNWHIEAICEYLTAVYRGDIKRLIINIPPRSMKSILVNVAFPAWVLGNSPHEKLLSASYGQTLSEKHSVDCRMLMESSFYKSVFPETQIVADQNTKRKFVTSKRGHRIATSVGGAATGEGGNFLIIDDPLSADDARSETKRQEAISWFDQTFSSRLDDKRSGRMIVVMQRLHENDLTGYLLEKGGWTHLKVPLIADKDYSYHVGDFNHEFKQGEVLQPERWPDNILERTKIEAGKYGFAGQYMQNPAPLGGGEFKKEWIKYYDNIRLADFNIYIMIDPANSKTKRSDYTCFAVMGIGKDGNYYLIDLYRDKLNIREREDLLFELHAKYKPQAVGYEKYGMQIDVDYMREAMERRNYRFHIKEIGGRAAKEDRIRRLVADFYDGRIYFPKRLYRTDYEGVSVDLIDILIHQEMLCFPVSLHDDMIDAISRIKDMDIVNPAVSNFNYYELFGSITPVTPPPRGNTFGF